MLQLFRYNWQVRDDWFEWCKQLSEEELLRRRTGGVGGILHTLFHIVDVEYSWICDLQGIPDFNEPFEEYAALNKVRGLSNGFHNDIKYFLNMWSDDKENRIVTVLGKDGLPRHFTSGEVLHHVIAHEIHHVGQLSVWARELGLQPVSPNFIGRGLAVDGKKQYEFYSDEADER